MRQLARARGAAFAGLFLMACVPTAPSRHPLDLRDAEVAEEDSGTLEPDSGVQPPDAGFIDTGVAEPDSGALDSGATDAGFPDTGVEEPDAGFPDTGVEEPDAGFPDTGVIPDAGFPDTGVIPDAGFPDSGVIPDAGFPDTGVVPDAGFPDTGVVPDAGFPDAGFVDSGVIIPDAGFPDSGVDAGQPDAGGGPGLPPRTPWPMGTTYIQSGHSLTDLVMAHPWPGRLVEAIGLDPAGDFQDIGKATIPGSMISWRWTHMEDGGDQSAQWPSEMPGYQALVITAAVPLIADDPGRQSAQVNWFRTAALDAWNNGNAGNGSPTLLYTTWTHLVASPSEPHPEDHLTFRQRLALDEPRWEQMQDFANASRPAGQTPVYLIPGNRVMMRIVDDIAAGTAPFTQIRDIFLDDIHLNATGMYAMTLLHYACIYGRDPGAFLPNTLVPQDNFPPAVALYLKRIVREEVTAYSSRTGLSVLSTTP